MRFPSIAAALAVAALLVSPAAHADDPVIEEVIAPPLPRLPPAPAPPPALGETGVVKLHIESSEPVRVFEHAAPKGAGSGGSAVVIGSSKLLCTSPCDRVIDARLGQSFSAQGDFPGVKSFTLNAFKDSVSLDVNPGSNALRTGGILATTLGGIAVLAGSTLLLLPSAINSGNSCCSGGGGKTVSLGVLVGGGVTLIGGIVLLVTSGTSWELHPTAPAKQAKARLWLGEL